MCIMIIYKDCIWYDYYILLNFVKVILGNIKYCLVFLGLILELIMNVL